MSAIQISAICPLKDEEENLPHIFQFFRPLGGTTEVLLVEGGSQDHTWKVAKKYHGQKNRFGVSFRAVKQKGVGKASAVSTGFDQAKGKYLLIVDGDLTIPFTDLRKMVAELKRDKQALLVCGNRLAGWSKPKSFYWLNYLGNYFFRMYYSLILQETILDIDCGSKALTKSAWRRLRALRHKEGSLDKWGDIDWLYFAKRIGLQICFVHVRYGARQKGHSKLQNLTMRFRYAIDIFFIGLTILKRSHLTDN